MWITAAMQDGNDAKRILVRCIGDQVIPHSNEPQWAVCKIGPSVTAMRKWEMPSDSCMDFPANSAGGVRVVPGNIFPDVEDVLGRFRMEIESVGRTHRVERFRRSSSRWRRASKKVSPSMGFTLPLLMSS